jgi:hypothetical protein
MNFSEILENDEKLTFFNEDSIMVEKCSTTGLSHSFYARGDKQYDIH